LILEVEEKGAKGTQLLVDAAGGAPGGQAGVDIVEDVAPLDAGQIGDRIVLEQPAPRAGVGVPEAGDPLVDPGGAPVRLLQVLVARQLLDQPGG